MTIIASRNFGSPGRCLVLVASLLWVSLCRGDSALGAASNGFGGASSVFVVIDPPMDAAKNATYKLLASQGITAENIRTEVELALKREGISFVTEDAWKNDPRSIILGIAIEVDGGEVQAINNIRIARPVICSINLGVFDRCLLERDHNFAFKAKTWERGVLGYFPPTGRDMATIHVERIRDDVVDLTKQFCADFSRLSTDRCIKKFTP